MKPVDSESLFIFVCDQMGKLDIDEITVEKAKAQESLAKQANNLLSYKLDLKNTEMKIINFNKDNNGIVSEIDGYK